MPATRRSAAETSPHGTATPSTTSSSSELATFVTSRHNRLSHPDLTPTDYTSYPELPSPGLYDEGSTSGLHRGCSCDLYQVGCSTSLRSDGSRAGCSASRSQSTLYFDDNHSPGFGCIHCAFT